ncbi:DNA replication licensing factor MCM2 [Trichinella nelsoni]|uniref:DNA replication licensing factor MCM2 n=1 Tax=Trichinella nelsoni TaxID=6336 RepID=A0A0V0S7Z1_9BILA|nr:DNA replication licensing factor MCM2 [Trichinella nelsoni]
MSQPSRSAPQTPSGSQTRRRKRRVQMADDDDNEVSHHSDAPRDQSALAEDIHEELFGEGLSVELEDEDEGEDLFGDDMERDYERISELDVFDESLIDDNSDYSELSVEARRAAEREMRIRDQLEGIGDESQRRLAMLYDELSDDEKSREAVSRRRRRQRAQGRRIEGEIFDEEPSVGINDFDVANMIRERQEWNVEKVPLFLKAVANIFRHFLKHFKDSKGRYIYMDKMREMCQKNLQSLVIDFKDLNAEVGGCLPYAVSQHPMEVITVLNEVVREQVLRIYTKYDQIASETYVRISNMPIMGSIRTLRQVDLNRMVRVEGVVTTMSGIIPQLLVVMYNCLKCGASIGPLLQLPNREIKPAVCPECQSSGPFDVSMQDTIYQNYQSMRIQESPNKIAAGRIPRSKDVILLADLCDSCKPGDEIALTGIYTHTYDGSLNESQGFPVFSTVIIANFIEKQEDKVAIGAMTQDDVDLVMQLSKDPNIVDRIFVSIAPSIYGHENIKKALALALVSGEMKNPGQKHRVRGDINVLMCGDPGTAKSQFLRYVAKTSPRAILTTGQGASAVGLTAYVNRNPVSREWTLEAGALVIADKGVCLIDEFDKVYNAICVRLELSLLERNILTQMNEQDRTSIHEAMEQQSISVSKAGVVASLQARCSVIAAANPIAGRYDQSRTFVENVDLSEPILSRFDILCVVRDTVDVLDDERLAKFVVGSHMRHHPDNDVNKNTSQDPPTQMSSADENVTQFDESSGLELIPQEILRKYIMYAREMVHPTLNKMDQDKVARIYSDLRRESLATGSIPITVRHVESIIRLSEAHAKLRLRNYVSDDDVSVAIQILLEAFIQTQKFSVMKQMRRNFFRYLSFNRDRDALLLHLLKQCVNEQLRLAYHKMGEEALKMSKVTVHQLDLLEKAKCVNIDNISSFLTSRLFVDSGFQYDQQTKTISQLL